MKNSETLKILLGNQVTTKNVKTFCNKNKKLSISYQKCYDVLIRHERKEKEKACKKFIKERAWEFNMSSRKYEELQQKSHNILESFYTGHSMGCYRHIKIKNRKGEWVIFASNNTLREYAKSCTWNPTYGTIELCFSKKELNSIEKVEGVWTIKKDHHKCTWLEQFGRKQNHTVNKVDGYLFMRSHATTLKEAKELERQKIIQERRQKLENKKFIGIQHVQKAGACMAGIKAFALRHNLNLDYGYRLDYLKELEDNNFLNQL